MTFSIDVGFVFALRQESVGIVDRLKFRKMTQGNGWTFHTGNLHDKNKLPLSAAVIMAGVGQKHAEDAANTLADVFAPQLVCSIGYAGGLSDRLKQGSICVPEQVIRQSDQQALDLSNSIPQRSESLSQKLTLITVNDVVATPERKRALHRQTGAELVDMETFAVADVCRSRAIPFLAARVVLDAVDDRIPKDIAKILDNVDKGISRLSGTILGRIWSRPMVVRDLALLQRRSFLAAERLAQFTIAELSTKKDLRRKEIKLEE